MNDQTPSKESVEHENKIADENVDLEYVESQVSTEPEIQHKSSNRRVTKELLSEAGKLKCQECERIFNSQPALQHHTKSKHKGVKYACNNCDYQATAKGVLKIHVQSKHEGVKYACNQCDYRTGWKGDLASHMKKKHL